MLISKRDKTCTKHKQNSLENFLCRYIPDLWCFYFRLDLFLFTYEELGECFSHSDGWD